MKPDLTAAELVEQLEALVQAAYHEGAIDIHNSWVDGHGQSEPDFGEAASDYAKSIDWATILTALRAQTAGEGDALSRQQAEIAELREALKDVTVHLIAAHSLLSRSSKKAAPSNKMFDQMLRDYEVSFERGRAALTKKDTPDAG